MLEPKLKPKISDARSCSQKIEFQLHSFVLHYKSFDYFSSISLTSSAIARQKLLLFGNWWAMIFVVSHLEEMWCTIKKKMSYVELGGTL